jgi:hypothetical protein
MKLANCKKIRSRFDFAAHNSRKTTLTSNLKKPRMRKLTGQQCKIIFKINAFFE